MKKSNAILIVLFIHMGWLLFGHPGIVETIILRLAIPILFVGYFIVKQLEENK